MWNHSSANLLATTIDKTLNNPSDIFQNSTKFPCELHRNPLVFPVLSPEWNIQCMHISLDAHFGKLNKCHTCGILSPFLIFDIISSIGESPCYCRLDLRSLTMASSIWIMPSAWTPFIAPETPGLQSPPRLFGYSFAHRFLGGRSMACMPPSRSNLKKAGHDTLELYVVPFPEATPLKQPV